MKSPPCQLARHGRRPNVAGSQAAVAGRERGHACPVPSPSQPPGTSRRVADRPRCAEVFRVRYRACDDAQKALYDSDWLVQTVDFCGHISRKQAMCVCVFVFVVLFVCVLNI